MARRFLLLLIFFFLILLPAQSQNSTFINYGTAEGLNHTQLFDITQDDYGGLWLMPYSSSTIYRFDGAKFERLLLKVPGVESVIKPFQIVADGKKRVLFLTNVGLVEYDGTGFNTMTCKDVLTPSLGSVLYLDKRSKVWIIDQTGYLFHQPDANPEMVRHPLSITGRPLGFFEYENELMLFTNYGEIHSLTSDKKVSLPWLEALPGFTRITQDGTDYYIFFKDKIVSYDSKTSKHSVLNSGPIEPNRRTQVITDEDKNIWVLSMGKVTRIGKEGPRMMDGEVGFTHGFVHRMFKDRYNTLWFGTDSDGLYHYIANQPLSFYSNGEPVPTVLPLDQENILCGMPVSGIMTISEKNCMKGPLYKELSSKNVTSLTRGPGDDLLAGTMTAGLFRVDKKGKLSQVKINSNLGVTSIYQIAHDSGSYWALSRVGLHNFDTELRHRKSYALFSDLGIGSEVTFIYPLDTSSMLLGSSGNGLFRFFPSTGTVLTVPHFKKASVLYSMKQDEQKRFWFCGEFPFLLVLDEKFELIRELDLSQHCSNIWTLEFINKNQLLVGSTDGIFRLFLDDRLDIVSIKKLDRQDGHKGGEVFLGSMVKYGDKIWFGTGKGAYSYYIDNNWQTKKGPRTFIKAVYVTNSKSEDDHVVAKGIYGLPEDLKINYGDARLTFSFFASDFYSSQNILYRYYLEGVEYDWSKYSNVNQITYSNLKPGKYTFKVQSLGESMMLGSVVDYPFEVLPAFWQTISFKVFATSLTFFALIFAVRSISFRRLRQYRLTEEIRATEIGKIRKQMAMDFHDEMGNKLAGILAYINSLKFRSSQVATDDLVSYLEENATAVYHGTKDFIWSIDMGSNNLREVISYLRDFGVNFFEKHKIEFIIEKDILNSIFNRPLNDGNNRHIILLFKEAMTNVLKHSKCSKVYFDAMVVGKQCHIILEDNGIGFRDNEKGKGIRSMKERARRINGTVKFLNKQPHGTRIILEFAV